MKKQNTAGRRAALAVLYLAVLAAAVMYLRVTISVPAEGDDKLTLNGWLYDMGRMSFWQYALQDLKERLSFFLLKQVRFFPFHYLPVGHQSHDGLGAVPSQPRRAEAHP